MLRQISHACVKKKARIGNVVAIVQHVHDESMGLVKG